MTDARAPFDILDTVPAAYRSAVASMRDLPTAFLTLCALLLVQSYLLGVLRQSLEPVAAWVSVTLSYTDTVLQAAVLAPFAVLVHRRIILDEIRDRYWEAVTTKRTAWFFGLALLVDVGYQLSGDIPKLAAHLDVPQWVRWALYFVLLVGGIRLVLATILMFPAIATDRIDGAWEMSAGHTRGRLWPLLGTFALANAPLYMLVIGVMWQRGFDITELIDGFVIQAVGTSIGAFFLILNVAIASHLYVHRAAWSRLTFDATPLTHPNAQPPLT